MAPAAALGPYPAPSAVHCLAQAQARQITAEYAALQAKRAGIEATISQIGRSFGLRRSRYIGLAKTRLQHVITAAALTSGESVAGFMGSPGLAPDALPTHNSWKQPEFAGGITYAEEPRSYVNDTRTSCCCELLLRSGIQRHMMSRRADRGVREPCRTDHRKLPF